jgi:hypothetical protein
MKDEHRDRDRKYGDLIFLTFIFKESMLKSLSLDIYLYEDENKRQNASYNITSPELMTSHFLVCSLVSTA